MFDVDSGEHPVVAPAGQFADFYRLELDGQVRRAALMLGSSAFANDVVHDAFLQIYRRWDEIAEPGPYLNRAVLNGCRDVSRRRGRDLRLLPRLVDRSMDPSSARAAGSASADDGLGAALSTLPFNHRAAIVLRFYVGLSIREIARTLDCPPGTVGPWITRGLQRLRQEIER